MNAENKTRYPARKMSSGVPAGLGRYTGGSALMDSVDGYLREDKMEKSRERNREHAKRTRLRKKVAIESMKDRLIELQNEVRILCVTHSPFKRILSLYSQYSILVKYVRVVTRHLIHLFIFSRIFIVYSMPN